MALYLTTFCQNEQFTTFPSNNSTHSTSIDQQMNDSFPVLTSVSSQRKLAPPHTQIASTRPNSYFKCQHTKWTSHADYTNCTSCGICLHPVHSPITPWAYPTRISSHSVLIATSSTCLQQSLSNIINVCWKAWRARSLKWSLRTMSTYFEHLLGHLINIDDRSGRLL